MRTNLLAKEKSPYLLQHAHNPVDWHPWGEEAFAKAKREEKPVFLSIGYSTCHWCHVMAHESFENSDIAQILNDHFISVKVDREERPDIDGTYMAVVVAMTGGGGWPMSVFLTPDKKPFYGGTYFPPEARWGSPGFKDILLSISNAWKTRRDEILQSSESITDTFRSQAVKEKSQSSLDDKALDMAYRQFSATFDAVYGGFGKQPKFPTTHNLSFLLRYWKKTGESRAFTMAEKTLQSMMKGGMYDHLGGGFHRYSTDQKWHVPHFEKMLYDQALIAKTYVEAYQATENKEYAGVAGEIFDYVLRDMQGKDGGFFSAEDADSLPAEEASRQEGHKKEGAFFVWGADEILSVLGKEGGEIFNYYFAAEQNGNVEFDPHNEFSGKNILYVAHTVKETAEHFKKTENEIEDTLKQSKLKLFKERNKRPRPHLDDKILVDWNGLMISSLAFGSRVLGDTRYARAGEEAAQFIFKNLVRKDGRLLHRYRDGESAVLGTIDDYAFFIHGLIDLYEATFKVEYLSQGKKLAAQMIRLFWDQGQGGFFFVASDAEQILFSQKEIYDGAVPSGNAVAALDLIRLARLTGQSEWEDKAKRIFDCFAGEIFERSSGYTQMLMALDFALGPSKEIVISGDLNNPEAREMIEYIYKSFLPNKVVLFRPVRDKEAQEIIKCAPFVREQVSLKGKTTAYVCENHVCRQPVIELHQLREFLDNKE